MHEYKNLNGLRSSIDGAITSCSLHTAAGLYGGMVRIKSLLKESHRLQFATSFTSQEACGIRCSGQIRPALFFFLASMPAKIYMIQHFILNI